MAQRRRFKKTIPQRRPRGVDKDPVYMGLEQDLKDIKKKLSEFMGTPQSRARNRRVATKEAASTARRRTNIQRGTTSGTGPRAAARRSAQQRRAQSTSPTKPNRRPRG